MKTILALGDSFTIGEAVGAKERWPVQLAASLRMEGLPVQDPEIIAKTGWTTGELLEGLKRTPPAPPYDLVSLLIGVNNQYREYSLKEYETDFDILLEMAVGFAGREKEHVMVLSIPDWSMTPFAKVDARSPDTIRRQVQLFNQANRRISNARGISYLDVFPISLQAGEEGALIALDGLHPSGEQYRRWVEIILPVAISKLKNKGAPG